MSSGGRVFPSITGGGLSRGAEAFVASRERARQLALQKRQLSNQERITALNAFTTLVPFLATGTTLGDTDPATQALFGQAFEVDPLEFLDLDLNKETVDTFVDKITLEGFQDLTPEELASNEVIRANQGLTPIQEVADVTRDEAAMRIEAFRRIQNDPARLDDFVARVEGLDPITVVFPGTRPDMTFERVEAATLFVSMLRDQNAEDARFGNLEDARRSEIIDQIRDAVRQREFEVGAPAVSRVLDIYDSAIEAQDGSIIDAFLASGATEGEKLAMDVVRGSMAFGDEFLFEGFPPEMRKLMQVAAVVESIQKADPKAVADLVDQLAPIIFGSFKRGPFNFGRPEFILAPTGAVDIGGGRGGTIDPRAASLEVQILGVIDVLGQELPEGQTADERRDILIGQVGLDAVVAAEGRRAEAEVDEVPPVTPERSAVQQQVIDSQQRQINSLNRLLSESTSEEVKRNLGRRIKRLEAEIAIDSTTLPIEREGTDEIPAGGIDPANMPASLRARVLQLNSLIRRRESFTPDVRAPHRPGAESQSVQARALNAPIERALAILRRLLSEN